MFRSIRIWIISLILFLPASVYANSDRLLAQNDCLKDRQFKSHREISDCAAIDRSRFHQIRGHPVGDEIIIIHRPQTLAPNRPYNPVDTPTRRQLLKEDKIRRDFHMRLEGIQTFDRKGLQSPEFL